MGICNPLSPDSYLYLVRVPLVSPYAFRWVLQEPRTPELGSLTFVKDSSPSAPHSGNASILHMGDERVAQNSPFGKWQHISMSVDGEVAHPVDESVLSPSAIRTRGSRSSLLKARLTLAMGTSRVRYIDFDVSAGVEFDVAAYSVQKIEVLVPDPRVDIPNEPDPIGDDPGPLQLETLLRSSVYFTLGSARQHNPLTYTVPVILAGEAQASWLIPRVADSVDVTGGIDAIAADGATVMLDFVYVPDWATAPNGVAEVLFGPPFPPFFVLDTVVVPTGSSRFPRTTIPGNANAFLVRRTIESDDTYVSVVQILNV